MRQLSKSEILALPEGIWQGHVRLSLISEEAGKPKTFLATKWPISIEKTSGATILSAVHLTWAQYTVEINGCDNGDLVFEDFLMQLYVK